MSSTRLLKQKLLENGKKMSLGFASSVVISNVVQAESQAIQYRAVKLTAMLGIGSFIINCVKSTINGEKLCQNLCTSLAVSQNPRDILRFAKKLFSGDTSNSNLDAILNDGAHLTGQRMTNRQKIEGRYIAGTATVALRFLSLLAEDTASVLLGYAVLHGLGLNYMSKELGASVTQTLFATTLTAGLELASEQISHRMKK